MPAGVERAGALRIGEVGDVRTYGGSAFSDYMTLIETPVHGDLSSDFLGALGEPRNTGAGGALDVVVTTARSTRFPRNRNWRNSLSIGRPYLRR